MFYIEEFLNHLLENRYSFKTVKHYADLLQHFKNYIIQCVVSDVKNISQNESAAFLNSIKKKNISDREYYLRTRRLIKYFQYL